MGKLEILVVEDKEEDFNTLKRGIKSIYQDEARIYHVLDECEIDSILSERPTVNVIFMDLQLSDSDKECEYRGISAIEKILSSYVTMPIVIITGYFKDTIHSTLRQQTLDDKRRIVSILDKMNYTREDLYVAIEQCIYWKNQYDDELVKQQEINELIVQYEQDLEKARDELTKKINEMGVINLHPAKDKKIYSDYLILKKSIKAIDPRLAITKNAISDLIKISTSDSKYIDTFFRNVINQCFIGKTNNRPIHGTTGIWEHKSGSYRIYFSKMDSNISILNIAHKNRQNKIINSFN